MPNFQWVLGEKEKEKEKKGKKGKKIQEEQQGVYNCSVQAPIPEQHTPSLVPFQYSRVELELLRLPVFSTTGLRLWEEMKHSFIYEG